MFQGSNRLWSIARCPASRENARRLGSPTCPRTCSSTRAVTKGVAMSKSRIPPCESSTRVRNRARRRWTGGGAIRVAHVYGRARGRRATPPRSWNTPRATRARSSSPARSRRACKMFRSNTCHLSQARRILFVGTHTSLRSCSPIPVSACPFARLVRAPSRSPSQHCSPRHVEIAALCPCGMSLGAGR